MSKKIWFFIIIGLTAIICSIILFTCSPTAVKIYNGYDKEMTQADLETNYHTALQTETTLRAYLASYESDRIIYISNKDYTDKESQELSRAAKTRANRTAATYNQLLQHSTLEHIKVPEELMKELPYIEEEKTNDNTD